MRGTVAKRIRREAYGKDGASSAAGRRVIQVNQRKKRFSMPFGEEDILFISHTAVNQGARLLYQIMKRNYKSGIKH